MIRKLQIELKLPQNIQHKFLGSVLHGALMDYLPNEMTEYLHHSFAYSPLKQRVFLIDDKVVWEIVSMNQDLSTQLLKLFSENTYIYLKQYDFHLSIEKFDVQNIDVTELMNNKLSDEDLSRYIKLKIVTPMSYKSNNKYAISPEIKMFFRSIMIQFDSFFSDYQMYDKETLDFIVDNVFIVDYRMKSTRFHLEKVKIPSFMGELTIKVNGPSPFLKLLHFLVAFGELSGVGIKTSLGMGKYHIISSEPRKAKSLS
ncbi:CRISPR-associated protein Cas6 [Staphylococcus microti]|uniref:CRISPR associated protein n=1 Tax=Staphylococcus microti TaxID=569857 RepID=A0A0D6XTM9_9STAP|nr:CRISPR-associated endoribonuclease Cas6 [Staphylococcus microti]KIX91213.1 CRISPR-associated protein Cas6 [Staphylococcus microti]PNZ79920.1 CRISPR-associated endoribonuclease Cas6 [Staphylococcus microti]SUM56464.1 CRISPR associated protein [Staphylococcus microti]